MGEMRYPHSNGLTVLLGRRPYASSWRSIDNAHSTSWKIGWSLCSKKVMAHFGPATLAPDRTVSTEHHRTKPGGVFAVYADASETSLNKEKLTCWDGHACVPPAHQHDLARSWPGHLANKVFCTVSEPRKRLNPRLKLRNHLVVHLPH